MNWKKQGRETEEVEAEVDGNISIKCPLSISLALFHSLLYIHHSHEPLCVSEFGRSSL